MEPLDLQNPMAAKDKLIEAAGSHFNHKEKKRAEDLKVRNKEGGEVPLNMESDSDSE